MSHKEGDTLLVNFNRDEGGHDETEMTLVGDQQLRWRSARGGRS